MAEKTYLDFLLTLKLPVIKNSDGSSAIMFADVPESLREPFKIFMIGVARPVIYGELCAWTPDWDLFLLQEKARCHADMEAGSLVAGARGPHPDELDGAPLMSDWLIVWHPHWERLVLIGAPSGHPTCKGRVTRSSPICGIDAEGRWARTISRWYRLGAKSNLEKFSTKYGLTELGLEKVVRSLEQAQIILACYTGKDKLH